MATSKVNAVLSPSQVPALHSLPTSFERALRLGWKIVKEESAITLDERKRTGAVLLRMKGSPVMLRVSYTATASQWKFGIPEPIATE